VQLWKELGFDALAGVFRKARYTTPRELINCIAALVPPPRTHRQRYFDVQAPNSPLRAALVGDNNLRPINRK
jgi:hypothetical protein